MTPQFLATLFYVLLKNMSSLSANVPTDVFQAPSEKHLNAITQIIPSPCHSNAERSSTRSTFQAKNRKAVGRLVPSQCGTNRISPNSKTAQINTNDCCFVTTSRPVHPSNLHNADFRKNSVMPLDPTFGVKTIGVRPSRVHTILEVKSDGGTDGIERLRPSTSDTGSDSFWLRYETQNDTAVANISEKSGKPKKSKTKESTKSKRKALPRTGDFPDVYWRSIPWEHLRLHPNFVPLPPPSQILNLETKQDVRRFRQDSWQWRALHVGRMTTSKATSALGFSEPDAGQALGIPNSLRSSSLPAFYHMTADSEHVIKTLSEMNRVLIENPYSAKEEIDESSNSRCWKRIPQDQKNKFPFPAKYMPDYKSPSKKGISVGNGVRMKWGNTQEATAILTALNYFTTSVDPNITVHEVGMTISPPEVGTNYNNSCSNTSDLLIGASPDAVLVYPNGEIEALEVKNHCPFLVNRRGASNNQSKSFYLSNRNATSDIPPGYIPQLMMEMFCLGPKCRSAVMVRQTAIHGAAILRVKRDDEWIDEMMYWLQQFQVQFVNLGVAPPPNFFWENGGDRYKEFVYRTKHIGMHEAELVAYVENNRIQRPKFRNNLIVPLFLDDNN
mmetsp:Transcript_14393/g.16571  ORF Transcript_14393/g.16571 Transcript_14393/m.16571 type:complete len:613 (-) Transcript_14393:100-1938(-)